MRLRQLACISLFVVPLILTVAANESEYQRIKAAALAKPRRVIADNDGCDVTQYPYSRCQDTSITAITNLWLSHFKDTEIDVVSYCPYGVGMQLSTLSHATEMHFQKATGRGNKNLVPELLAQGTDSLRIATEFCRKHQMEIFVNMRVNDTHDQWFADLLSETKKKHPEYLFGTSESKPKYGAWCGFDFAHPEVREKFRAIIFELLFNYDVDGLVLDFFRFPCFFKSVADGGSASPAEMDAMTQLARDIRNDAEWIGRRRGRYFVIAMRLPDNVKLARKMGLEIDRWMKEKLMDIYIPGADFAKTAFIADAIELGHRYQIKVFPSVDKSWLGGEFDFARDEPEAFSAQSAAALAAGADGIFYFNMVYHLDYLPQIRRDLAGWQRVSKRYFGYYHDIRSQWICAGLRELSPAMEQMGDRLLITDQNPAEMYMELGEKFSTSATTTAPPSIRLVVKAPETEQPMFRVEVNGHRLNEPRRVGGSYEFLVLPDLLKLGKNSFRFISKGSLDNLPAVIFKGDQLLRGNLQPPWRRLFTPHDFPNSEQIVEQSCRIVDSGDEAVANLIYPLPPVAGKLEGSFELMVEDASERGAVTVRLADGRHVEQIDFMPDEISLRYGRKSVKFPTHDRFHSYRFEFEANRFRLFADDRRLFDLEPEMSAGDPETRLRNTNYNIPGMHDRSLLIGSLSPAGKSSSRWKNVSVVFPSYPIHDVALSVEYPPEVPPELLQAAKDCELSNEFDASRGRAAFANWRNGYKADFFHFSEGALELDNRNPDNEFANITRDDPDVFASDSGIVVAEAIVSELVPEGGKNMAFSLGIQLPGPEEGQVYDAHIWLGANHLMSSLGGAAFPESDRVKVKLVVEHRTGRGVVLVNDIPVRCGNYSVIKGVPKIYFGDATSAVRGRCRVELVRFGISHSQR